MYITTSDLATLLNSTTRLPSDSDQGADDPLTSYRTWYTLLLAQTLMHAAEHVPFYSHTDYGEAAALRSFSKISDLRRLPVLTRQRLANSYSSFIATDYPPERATSTSGTTGRRLLIYGNRSEDEAIAVLRALSQGPALKTDVEPLTLRILPGNRRTHISSSTPSLRSKMIVIGNNISTPLRWFDYTDHVIDVLSETYYLGGLGSKIDHVHVTPPLTMELITRYMLDRGVDPTIFGIKSIYLSGSFLSRHAAQLIRKAWGVDLIHSYSCSEIFTEGIALVEDRDAFRFISTAFCEILDIDTQEPVSPGEAGLVVLTSLYPFQQCMPLLRYSVGDIALCLEQHPGLPVSVIKPIGRVGECIQLGPRQFIGTRDGFHAVTRFPELPQIPFPRFSLQFSPEETNVLCLDVEVNVPGYYSPTCNPTLVAEALAEEIHSYGYDLERLPKRVECRFLPKLTISDFPKILPER